MGRSPQLYTGFRDSVDKTFPNMLLMSCEWSVMRKTAYFVVSIVFLCSEILTGFSDVNFCESC